MKKLDFFPSSSLSFQQYPEQVREGKAKTLKMKILATFSAPRQIKICIKTRQALWGDEKNSCLRKILIL